MDMAPKIFFFFCALCALLLDPSLTKSYVHPFFGSGRHNKIQPIGAGDDIIEGHYR